jgi:hypothetical protein
MGMRNPHDEKTKRIGMAIGASIIAAVSTMFVPRGLLESLTGATGLSELFPATAAPLGDKARALIAFAAGAVTMAVSFGLLSRNNNNDSQSEVAGMTPHEQKNDAPQPALLGQIKARLVGLKSLKMPWTRDSASNDVYELSDLPKLRSQDAHPDMPRRRPISAASDFGDIGLDGNPVRSGPDHYGNSAQYGEVIERQPAVPAASPAISENTPAEDLPFFEDRDMQFVPADTGVAVDFVADFSATGAEPESVNRDPQIHTHADEAPGAPIVPTAHDEGQPTLSQLVAQFEAALENRKQQLAALEALAMRISEKGPATIESQPSVVPPVQQIVSAAAATRPPLEAVPASPRQQNDDDMDAALNAALATLQRMNAK